MYIEKYYQTLKTLHMKCFFEKFSLFYAYIAQFHYFHLNSNITKKFKKWQKSPKIVIIEHELLHVVYCL